MPTELIDLCYVDKTALIRMTLISIKLIKFSLRYYSLKWTRINGQNFWNNLIITTVFLNEVIIYRNYPVPKCLRKQEIMN